MFTQLYEKAENLSFETLSLAFQVTIHTSAKKNLVYEDILLCTDLQNFKYPVSRVG